MSLQTNLPVTWRGVLTGIAHFFSNRRKLKAHEVYKSTQKALNAARASHKQHKAPSVLYELNIAAKTKLLRAEINGS